MGNSISAPFSGLANRRLGRKPILWLFSFSPFTCNIYDIDVVAQSGAVEASSLESVNPEQIVDQQQQPQPQSEGSKWVELFVQEMLGACNLGDAKERAARALEAFEKSIMGRTGSLLEDLQKIIEI